MYRLLLSLTLTHLTFAAIVKWLPSTSFYSPVNFQDGQLPCSKQAVVFPNSIMQPVKFDSDLSVKEIILPETGEFIIESGILSFGADSTDTNCTREGNAYYKESAVSSWAQPNVWYSTRFNKATPDGERVPCFDDVVLFPSNSEFTLVLPLDTQYVQQFKIGEENYDDSRLARYILTQVSDQDQQFVLNEVGMLSVKVKWTQCAVSMGCPCQTYPLKIECSKKVCPIPTCLNPIQPIGHCCKICGGILAFEASDTFDYVKFKEFVDNELSSYSGIVYYLGRPLAKTVQLVVVEENDYTGISSEAANKISYLMDNHWTLRSTRSQLSGTPLYKYGLGGKIFVSMFFLVLFVLGLVYGYYYKIPDIRQPLMGRGWLERWGFFSRFTRRSESVVSLTRRDSGVLYRPGTRAGFRNPLYDSKRGRVQVTESKEE